MICPGLTVCPPKALRPRCCGLESRPLRVAPCPFLCAMSDLCLDPFDLHADMRLAMSHPRMKALPPAEGGDNELLVLDRSQHGCMDLRPRERRGSDLRLPLAA